MKHNQPTKKSTSFEKPRFFWRDVEDNLPPPPSNWKKPPVGHGFHGVKNLQFYQGVCWDWKILDPKYFQEEKTFAQRLWMISRRL